MSTCSDPRSPPAQSLEVLNRDAAAKIYTDLQDGVIRLVKLHAASGIDDDPVTCTLQIIRLNSGVQFEALSYVWGSIAQPRIIHLEGEEYSVTQNLDEALRYLRKSSNDRILWIDALAINQCQIPERNAQVQIMRDIYATAGSTIAWLGKGDGIPSGFFSFITAMKNKGVLLDDDLVSQLPERHKEMVVNATGILGRLPYWKRAWVLQETAFSKAILFQCGHYILHADAFTSFWSLLQRLLKPSREWKEINSQIVSTLKDQVAILGLNLKFLQANCMAKGFTFDYMEWLHEFCMQRECGDPKDKVFAAYGLLSVDLKSRLRLDYGLTVEEIYTEFTRNFMRAEDSKQPLKEVDIFGSGPRDTRTMPSWVPNYRNTLRRTRFNTGLEANSASIPAILGFINKGKVLKLAAYRLGQCGAPSRQYPSQNGDLAAMGNNLLTYYNDCKRDLQVTDEHLPEFALTFCGSHTPKDSFEEMYCLLELAPDKGLHPEIDYSHQHMLSRFHRTHLEHGLRVMFSFTPSASFHANIAMDQQQLNKMHFGLGPEQLQMGDEVYMILGFTYPFVLRSTEDGHICIGNAFLAGLHDAKSLWKMPPRIDELPTVSNIDKIFRTSSRSHIFQ